MNRICLALFCGLVGLVVTVVAIPSQVNKRAEAPTEKLIGTLRLLNTQEVLYYAEIRRFAPHDELLTFLRTKGTLSQSPIDLENPGPYELAITASADGQHYFITLKPQFDRSKDVWECGPAAFTDDAGVIFLGSALGCDTPNR